jgi:hypothetical protein
MTDRGAGGAEADHRATTLSLPCLVSELPVEHLQVWWHHSHHRIQELCQLALGMPRSSRQAAKTSVRGALVRNALLSMWVALAAHPLQPGHRGSASLTCPEALTYKRSKRRYASQPELEAGTLPPCRTAEHPHSLQPYMVLTSTAALPQAHRGAVAGTAALCWRLRSGAGTCTASC